MEIKIKKVYEKEGKHSYNTSIFEGDNVTHERVYFESRKDFIEKYNMKTKGLTGCVVGVPDDYWFNTEEKDKKEKDEGYFIFIQYVLNGGNVEFIVVMNRAIYITNRGQTIDVI